MSGSLKPNTWLQGAIEELYKKVPEEKLRESFAQTENLKTDEDWEDFLWHMALSYQIDEHPVLKTCTQEMPLSRRIKDIFKSNYIDALCILIQMSREELANIPGLTDGELRSIEGYLSAAGYPPVSNPEKTLKIAWNPLMEEREPVRQALEELKKRCSTIRKDNAIRYDEQIAQEIKALEQTDSRLLELGADKGTRQRFLWDYANYVLFHAHGDYDENERALGIAKRELSLKEYLRGPEDKGVGESYRLVGQIWQEQFVFPEAIRHLSHAASILEKYLGPYHPEMAELYNELGLCYLENRQYEESLGSFQKAYDAYMNQEKGPDRRSLGHLCYLISDAHFEQGESAMARKYIDMAKEFLK